jgi:hypothetical protein
MMYEFKSHMVTVNRDWGSDELEETCVCASQSGDTLTNSRAEDIYKARRIYRVENFVDIGHGVLLDFKWRHHEKTIRVDLQPEG